MTWLFIISMVAATFGGPFTVTFKTTSWESCKKLHKVVVRELEGMRMKYTITDCNKEEK